MLIQVILSNEQVQDSTHMAPITEHKTGRSSNQTSPLIIPEWKTICQVLPDFD